MGTWDEALAAARAVVDGTDTQIAEAADRYSKIQTALDHALSQGLQDAATIDRLNTLLEAAGAVLPEFTSRVTQPTEANSGIVDESKLRRYEGDITITNAGEQVRDLDVTGTVRLAAPFSSAYNVRSRVGKPAAPGKSKFGLASFDKALGTTFTHCEVDPSEPSVDTYGFSGFGATLRRVKILRCADAVNSYRNDAGTVQGVEIYDSYLQSQVYPSDPRQGGGQSHPDGVQISAGRCVVEGNTIVGTPKLGNGVVFTPIDPDGKSILTGSRVAYNWFDGFHTQVGAWNGSGKVPPVFGLEIFNNRHLGSFNWAVLLTAANKASARIVAGSVDAAGNSIAPYINK